MYFFAKSDSWHDSLVAIVHHSNWSRFPVPLVNTQCSYSRTK